MAGVWCAESRHPQSAGGRRAVRRDDMSHITGFPQLSENLENQASNVFNRLYKLVMLSGLCGVGEG